MSVGRHNTLSRSAAAGRTGPAWGGEEEEEDLGREGERERGREGERERRGRREVQAREAQVRFPAG